MKAAIYCRLSEEDREKKDILADSESIQNQKSLLTKYALEHGWEIFRIYSDENYSGADSSRPQFNRMIRDAENGKFNIMLCKTQSRFTRDMEIAEKYLHNLFPLWNIRFVTLVDRIDSADKGGKKFRQLGGLINEWFLEDLSDNIRTVLTDKRKRGEFIGSFAPYGYKKSKKNTLEVDEDAAAVVREIFERYIGGEGISSISNSLNDRGIPNPTGYREKNTGQYMGEECRTKHLWSYGAVGRILKNEVYTGRLIQGKYQKLSYKNQTLVRTPKDNWIVCEKNHTPLIDCEIFQLAQNRKSMKARPVTKGKGQNLFSARVRCLVCGNTMVRHRSKGIDYLRCRTNTVYHKGCMGVSIRCDVLEELIKKEWNERFHALTNKENIFHFIKIENNKDIRLQKLKVQIERERKNNKKVENTIMNLYLDKTRGVITDSQFLSLNQQMIKKIEIINKRLKGLEKEREELDREKAKILTREDLNEKYGDIKELTYSMVNNLIDHIDIGKGEGKRNRFANIYWNF